MLFKIRNWSKIYENNRTRDMKLMQWLALPIKLSGSGYAYLMTLPDGPAIFGCFVAILELAARCEPRGTLIRGAGIPHDHASIARQTRMPLDLIGKTLCCCSSIDCDWIEAVEDENSGEIESKSTNCGETAVRVARGCGKGALQDTTGQDTTLHYRTGKDAAGAPHPSINQRERELETEKSLVRDGVILITDQKLINAINETPPGKIIRSFARPTIPEIMAYCEERDNRVDPQKFYDHYESNGWKVGRNSMKDWRAAVRTWEKNEYDKKPPVPGNKFGPQPLTKELLTEQFDAISKLTPLERAVKMELHND